MRLIVLIGAVFLFGNVQAQKKKDQKPLDLTNVVIIGQMDDTSDRYSVEINMTELFSTNGVKSKASLNLMKQGADSEILASDSLKTVLEAQGYDTYLLSTVRGYDKRFKMSDANDDFKTSLGRGNLFSIYQEGVVSVSFEFKFFRNGELVRDEVIKCGNAGSREKVLSKLRKKVRKRLVKDWK